MTHVHTLFHPHIFESTEEFKWARLCHSAMVAYANGTPGQKTSVPPKAIEAYTAALNRIMKKDKICKKVASKRLGAYIREEWRRRNAEVNTGLSERSQEIAATAKKCLPYTSANRD